MRLLLATLNAKYIHTNLAVRLLYELNRNTKGLEWKEFTIKEDENEVASECALYNVVAFSCYIWNITRTLQVAAKIKAIRPETKILLGGPEVSYEYNDVIARPEVDYIIVGEGEIPFAEFINAFPHIQNVQGLVWKSNDGIHRNAAPPLFDLKNFEDSMPYSFDKPEELKNKVLYIETSRGCPYKCEFCLASLDNKVRYLPDSAIRATLLYLMQHGRVIKFLDRTFNIKRDFTIGIFRFILENHKPGNVFQFEITADILHPDIIQFIREHVPKGLFRFEIGIQTVNREANLEVSRKQNFEKTKQIIRQLDDIVEMHLDLIVGLPLDYWADVKRSFEEVFILFAPEMQLGFLKFLKGTTMRGKEQHGFVYDSQPPYQLIKSKYLSREELHKITQLEHALEIYWNSGKARNTLKYVAAQYSSFDFLLELGIFFGTQKSYHQYSLDDVFIIATAYVRKNYPNDRALQQLLALDYHLHFKVRPRAILGNEADATQKWRLLQKLKFQNDGYRYTVLNTGLDALHFKNTGKIKTGSFYAVIRYNGLQKAQLVAAGEPEPENVTGYA